ncbi:MAG TPA: Mur ligase family protein [Gaiella sp.]|jgi:UDP-N-acetylmuramoylalanine--D-glutamate ligase|nr:Mur ligase family protein [Gaiella sp.]
MKRILVEGFDRDAVVLARTLAREGHRVTLAGPGDASQQALELRASRVVVRARASLDTEPGHHDEAFLDVWTPEVAPRVALLRESGCVVRCLGDRVLERSPVPTIGVTGTAGKTTTAAFLAYLLRTAGSTVHTGTTARAGNLWPTAELLPPPTDGVVLMELTSSHLCFTTSSPTIAVITCFWPDHLELHGSLERYRAAKEAIVRHQRPSDIVVANEDDGDAAAIASLSPGRHFGFSATREVEAGAFVRGSEMMLRDAAGERSFALPPTLDAPRLQALLAAAATALAAGALPETLRAPEPPPYRAARVGRLGDTELIDDGMAATPSKTASALHEFPDASVVLVAGGELEAAGLPVHASREERKLLEEACAEARRVARLVVLFGPAATRLASSFDRRATLRATTLDEAIALASTHAEGAKVLVVSPMFPLPPEDRERIAPALRALSETGNTT